MMSIIIAKIAYNLHPAGGICKLLTILIGIRAQSNFYNLTVNMVKVTPVQWWADVQL